MWECPRVVACEDPRRIPKRLDLNCISAGIVEKHGGLFPDLTCKADARSYAERHAGILQLSTQTVEGFPLENDTKMANGHRIAVNRIAVKQVGRVGRLKVSGDLVTCLLYTSDAADE